MSKSKTKTEICALIEEELNNINLLLEEMSKCKENNHIFRRAKGSILHDFYNACERIFETIIRQMNGNIPEGGQWHKRLLYQITMEIKSIRPPVISKQLAAELDEYLAFRHLFRNIYGFELESERIDRLAEKFPKIANAFRREIKNFLAKL